MYLQLDLLINFNTVCSFVTLHRQVKTRLALLLAIQGYSHTGTLHQTDETGKAGEMFQQIKTFFHIYQGVFMWNETGKWCP
jgi:hypothetical protein